MRPSPCLYDAFGVGLSSEIAIPELHPAVAGIEAVIRVTQTRLESISDRPAGPDGGWSLVRGGAATLGWDGVGTYRASAVEIAVDPDPAASPERVRLFLLGPVMGVALHLRELLVLHGSAVALNGGAVVFLGPKWSGKSTMAGSLVARGHDLITDDVVAIDVSGPEPLVRPGFSQLKLWPEALSAIGVDGSTLQKIHPDFDKRYVPVGPRFHRGPLPLRAIVFLTKAEPVALDELDSVTSLAEIIRHWYCARFGYDTLAELGISSQFLGTTRLADTARCCRLGRPACLTTISDVAEAVEKLL